MKIGFFDSGIGGLTVLHCALKMLPNEQFLYYADEKHVPYGEKQKEEIIRYVNEAVEFMIKSGAKAIVLACNTATSAAAGAMRKKYKIPIIGMEPAIKKAIETYKSRRIFVAATPVTVRGEKMKKLIDKVDTKKVTELIPMPMLVRFAEEGKFNDEGVLNYIREKFQKYNFDEYSSLVLGCTHFNYFKDSFRKVLPKSIHFVDGNSGTVSQLIRKLKENSLMENNKSGVEFYESGEKVKSVERLKYIDKLLERIDIMYDIE